MSQYSIETVNLTKSFRSKVKAVDDGVSIFRRRKTRVVTAVDHLNLQIRKGELFGLLGPNGAGKTTLVKVLCTLLPPDDGTAKVNGFDVAKQAMQVKRSIGTLFSIGERGFFWRLSGYRNLEFFAAINNVPRGQRHEKIMEVLDLVGLKDSADEHFQKYSGGMKRKLALARTLIADPSILLLDEPTSGLDVTSSRSMRDFIRNDLTRKGGKTVLYTTHYVEEAAQICDRIGIMNKGRIIALDTPNALKSLAKKGEVIDMVVKDLSDAHVIALRRMEGVASVAAETLEEGFGQIHLRIRLEKPEVLPSILNFFFGEKIKLINFKQEEATLEDAFIELIERGVSL
jgi:ABC-2 type transport system ATP-binding protein